MSDPIEDIRKRVAAWGREDSRVLLAEIDRLLSAEALLAEVTQVLYDTPPGVPPGMTEGQFIFECFGCTPEYQQGKGWRHTEGCPIGRAIAYVAAKNTTGGG